MGKRILSIAIFLGMLGVAYVFLGLRYGALCETPRGSCLEHRQAGCSIDGEYKLKLGARAMGSTCDMTTEGGGWTLVANYLHHGGSAKHDAAQPLIDRLPLQGDGKLGGDESGTPAWGHAANSLLSAIPFQEARFKCRTSAHSRLVDFSVYAPHCLDYLRTGKGACLGTPELRDELKRNVRMLPGHDGELPLTADKGWANQGEYAMVYYPFFVDWRNNWSIANRWQCDDTQAEDKADTWHQVWVR